MNQKRQTVLIIDDEESICWGLAKLCEQMGIDCETASSAEAGFNLAREKKFQAIIMDIRLPGTDGVTAIKYFHQHIGPIPIITITAFGDLQTAINAIQNGAFEYIVKPFELDKVQQTITQALATWNIANEPPVDQATATNGEQPDVSGLIGSSPIMQEVFKQIALTTTTDSPVLITGEPGTGKELSARAIHRFSKRSQGPFVAVNVASLNPSTAEAELFGEAQGAVERAGLIQQAAGGTLYLDEVAETPLEIQVKLLRVLDQGEVIPVGSNTLIKTDFRLLSATHQDLLSQVNHGEFRHDLFYRLRTFEIHLPPLREHREDIPALAQHFLQIVSSGKSLTLSREFVEALKKRRWIGNVRELRNVVERAAVLARGGVLTVDHIEEFNIDLSGSQSTSDPESELYRLAIEWIKNHWDSDSDLLYEDFLAVVEPAILQTSFELADRQYSAAAKRLGIHRTTLKKRLDEFAKHSVERNGDGSR